MLACNLLSPADGALAGDDITFSIVEAEVVLHVTDALTRQTVHAQIAGVTNTLGLTGPLIDHTPGKLVARLKLTWICSVA